MANEYVAAPKISHIQDLYQPGCGDGPAPPIPNEDVVAVITASFGGIDSWSFDSHRLLTAQVVQDHGQNAWTIPTHERMPYPDSLLYSMCTIFNAEKLVKRKIDWILYVEDDISVPKDLLRTLMASADPETRPFMATVGYMRGSPFLPAVWGGTPDNLTQWRDVPDHGVYKVAAVGMCACLMHRSLFDRVPQPWWLKGNNMVKIVDGNADMEKGFNPDNWWCGQLARAGIPIYVDCTPVITHFGMPMPINRKTAPVLRELTFFRDKYTLEQETRGECYNKNGMSVCAEPNPSEETQNDEPKQRIGSPVHACVRQADGAEAKQVLSPVAEQIAQ